MATYAFPASIPARSVLTPASNTNFHISPISKAVQTAARDGEHWRMLLSFSNLTAAQRRRLLHTLAVLNGQTHRLAIRDHSYSGPAGSISVSNLNSKLTAANYPTAGSWLTVTDLDDGIRHTRRQNTANGEGIFPDSLPTTVAGTSYSLKTAVIAYPNKQARGQHLYVQTASGSADIYTSGTVNYTNIVSVAGFTAVDTVTRAGVTDNAPPSGAAFSVWDLTRSELARCLLIDNGFNVLTYSEQLDHADWTKVGVTISADQAVSINADTTADYIVEDSSSGEHRIQQTYTRSSVAEYWTGSGFFREVDNQRLRIIITDTTAAPTNFFQAWFDANSGTVSTAASAAGTAENAFASIEDWGGGIYRFRLSGRLPASTTVRIYIYVCDGATDTTNFVGDGSSRIEVWGAQLQRGGQIGRYVKTEATATTGTAQSGHEIWVKGLDKDTDGQLLPGDQVEINGQLCIVQNSVDGDESGSGILTVWPRIRDNTSDEDAVVLYQPEGRFMLANPSSSFDNAPGQNILSNFTLDLIEDIAS